MSDLASYRRYFAEEIQMVANLQTPALVEALATVPREQFLPPGPWVVRSDADVNAGLRHSIDADPRHVYHNVAVGIDPARMLFNGAPATLCSAIDALGLGPGKRVLHIGTGAGYYTAVMAHAVGPTGRVVGIEVDEALARMATASLAPMPWVTVQHSDGRGALDDQFDAILVNAGITHPEPHWLRALALGGRMNLSITVSLDLPGIEHPAGLAMANIGKGFMILLERGQASDALAARLVNMVAIYSAIALRDPAINTALGASMSRAPFPALKRFRLDAHEPEATCWCHTARGCWSLA